MSAPAFAGEPADMVGTTLLVEHHHFTVRRVLAEGGKAVVFLVEERGGKQYAMKRVVVSGDQDRSVLAAADREVAVLRQFKNAENIVNLRAAERKVVRERRLFFYFIVMSFCPETVLDIMRKAKRGGASGIARPILLQIVRDTCRGVLQMHLADPPLAHRDIKVENVLLDDYSNRYQLCDFGSATSKFENWGRCRAAERQAAMDDIESNTTVEYRAPEQCDFLLGTARVDQRVDAWALGCMLFHLMYFATPFENGTKLQVMNVDFKFPSQRQADLNAVVSRLLVADPDARMTVAQLLQTVCEMGNFPTPPEVAAARERGMYAPAVEGGGDGGGAREKKKKKKKKHKEEKRKKKKKKKKKKQADEEEAAAAGGVGFSSDDAAGAGGSGVNDGFDMMAAGAGGGGGGDEWADFGGDGFDGFGDGGGGGGGNGLDFDAFGGSDPFGSAAAAGAAAAPTAAAANRRRSTQPQSQQRMAHNPVHQRARSVAENFGRMNLQQQQPRQHMQQMQQMQQMQPPPAPALLPFSVSAPAPQPVGVHQQMQRAGQFNSNTGTRRSQVPPMHNGQGSIVPMMASHVQFNSVRGTAATRNANPFEGQGLVQPFPPQQQFYSNTSNSSSASSHSSGYSSQSQHGGAFYSNSSGGANSSQFLSNTSSGYGSQGGQFLSNSNGGVPRQPSGPPLAAPALAQKQQQQQQRQQQSAEAHNPFGGDLAGLF